MSASELSAVIGIDRLPIAVTTRRVTAWGKRRRVSAACAYAEAAGTSAASSGASSIASRCGASVGAASMRA